MSGERQFHALVGPWPEFGRILSPQAATKSVPLASNSPRLTVPGREPASDFTFTGHLIDRATNLNFAIFRAYDANEGRWLSADPSGLGGGLNLYGYVDNDPIKSIDPSGLSPQDDLRDAWWLPPGLKIFGEGVRMRGDGISMMANEATFERGMAKAACGASIIAASAGIIAADAQVLAGAADAAIGAVSPILNASPKSLQKAFGKHGKDPGVVGNWSTKRAPELRRAINAHINDPAVLAIAGTYRNQPATHYFNPATGVNVIADQSGNFVTGWRLGVEQMENLMRNGSIW